MCVDDSNAALIDVVLSDDTILFGWNRPADLQGPGPRAPTRSPPEQRFPLAPPGQSLPQPAHTPKRITEQFALMEAWISCSNSMSLVVSTLVFRSGRLLGKHREKWLRCFFFRLRVGQPSAGLQVVSLQSVHKD